MGSTQSLYERSYRNVLCWVELGSMSERRWFTAIARHVDHGLSTISLRSTDAEKAGLEAVAILVRRYAEEDCFGQTNNVGLRSRVVTRVFQGQHLAEPDDAAAAWYFKA